ncbi:MAG: hypothetical protein ACRDPG_12415 [Nocardioidaceae bacterium]
MSAPEVVHLHIGLHKTGTTYLQNLMRANRDRMRAQGVEFTGGPGEPVQAFAVLDLQGRRPRGTKDARVPGSWDALVRSVNTCGLDAALISEERLSLCSPRQARKAVAAFPDSQVHVVVTVRDLARVAVSAWQEEVKNDQTWTWQEFVSSIKDPSRSAVSPARGFWLRQDLAKICETWEAGVPAGRMHVVTVPPSGTSPEVLLDRFASVVGFRAGRLTEHPHWTNEMIGVAGTEVIRRVNERLGGRLNQRQYDKAVKLTLVQMLAGRAETTRFTLPSEELDWVRARAEEMILAVEKRGYHVVGSLDELRPRLRQDARRPDDVTRDELLDASLDALAMLAERFATSWWQRRKEDASSGSSRTEVASLAREMVFRGQTKAAGLADRNSVAAKLMAGAMRVRDRARLRARHRGA